MKKLVALSLLLALTVATTAGGPWVQSKGKGYYKLSEWWLVFDQHYTDAGLLDPNVTTGIFNTTAYAEYGITNRFTGIFNGVLLSRNYMNNIRSATTEEILIEGESVNALGDIDLGVKYGISKPGAKYPLAASIIFGIPTGTPSAGSQGNLQTGDGEFNQLLSLHGGTSFSLFKKSLYSTLEVGFNNRSNGFSDEFRYGLEVGMEVVKERLWVNARLTGIESFKNAEAGEITSVSIFANNTEFTSFGLEASYYISSRWGVSAGMAGAFRGEIIAAAPSYTAGIFFDLTR